MERAELRVHDARGAEVARYFADAQGRAAFSVPEDASLTWVESTSPIRLHTLTGVREGDALVFGEPSRSAVGRVSVEFPWFPVNLSSTRYFVDFGCGATETTSDQTEIEVEIGDDCPDQLRPIFGVREGFRLRAYAVGEAMQKSNLPSVVTGPTWSVPAEASKVFLRSGLGPVVAQASLELWSEGRFTRLMESPMLARVDGMEVELPRPDLEGVRVVVDAMMPNEVIATVARALPGDGVSITEADLIESPFRTTADRRGDGLMLAYLGISDPAVDAHRLRVRCKEGGSDRWTVLVPSGRSDFETPRLADLVLCAGEGLELSVSSLDAEGADYHQIRNRLGVEWERGVPSFGAYRMTTPLVP